MKYLIVILIPWLLAGCVPITPSTSTNYQPLRIEDYNYAQNVGAVTLTPKGSNSEAAFPVIALGSQGVVLEMDVFENNVGYLNAKLIHCNADWTQSVLIDLQYMNGFNEFPSQDYSYSENTRIPYVQYRFDIPSPTISGNYLLIVYRENDQKNLVLSRRMVVFESKVAVAASVNVSSMVSKRTENHQIEFDIDHTGIRTNNPINDLSIVVLQNHNWNNALKNLQPTVIRSDKNALEYRHFDGTNNFRGLNEFRFFDLRFVDFRGININRIVKSEAGVQAYLVKDKSREHQAYAQLINDRNGGFLLQNKDPDDSQLQSEYVLTHFELEHERLETPVHIISRQNNWELNNSNLMEYDEYTKSYKGQLLLKQGYYDYAYWLETKDGGFSRLEGNHFQTDNTYEIIVYYRNTSNNYDEIIGYKNFSSQQN
ncbi:MAG: DUF5103 domain-containing protein [Cyclobacteriaceae bacterium]